MKRNTITQKEEHHFLEARTTINKMIKRHCNKISTVGSLHQILLESRNTFKSVFGKLKLRDLVGHAVAGFLRLLRFPLPRTHSNIFSTIITIYYPGLVYLTKNCLSTSGLGATPAKLKRLS
jgi:hypothetical protein